MMMKMKSHSMQIEQAKLHALSQKIMEHFEQIQQCLNIRLNKTDRMYFGSCPIHGGDKSNALNIYREGDTNIGNWKCRTAQCEKHFVGSIIGFIRGCLSHNKYGWTGPGDQTVGFRDTLDFISACLDEDYNAIEIDFNAMEKAIFVANFKTIKSRHIKEGETRKNIRKDLKIPATYYIERGYNSDILDKYDVGLCLNPQRDTFQRITVPIYDDKHKFVIGTTSRSIYDKCNKCGTWHSPVVRCPRPEEGNKYAKWKHSLGFKKEEHLYNYWYALNNIVKTRVAILTESPGNVWRLEEAGIPVGLATYGASFSAGQKQLLNQAGAMTIIVAMDNDEAGQKCAKDLDFSCKSMYHIYNFVPTKNDLGDMTVDEIRQTLSPLYENCIKEWQF